MCRAPGLGGECEVKNVRVNSVSPRAIATGIVAKALGMQAAAADTATGTIEEFYAKAQPIPRAGVPDDIAQCVVWLASDRSTFVNGSDIVVDDGDRRTQLRPAPGGAAAR
jgi:NAD(P)-dependent dehydrogenase (short-subunit alcohol dehydrogenase family)